MPEAIIPVKPVLKASLFQRDNGCGFLSAHLGHENETYVQQNGMEPCSTKGY